MQVEAVVLRLRGTVLCGVGFLTHHYKAWLSWQCGCIAARVGRKEYGEDVATTHEQRFHARTGM